MQLRHSNAPRNAHAVSHGICERVERMLDEALAASFPCSDPVSFVTTEPVNRRGFEVHAQGS
jgi:hypothetical protein